MLKRLLGAALVCLAMILPANAQDIRVPPVPSVYPPATMYFKDDFHTHGSSSVLIGELGWLLRAIAGATATGLPQSGVGSNLGVVRLSTSTTTSGHGASLGWDATGLMFNNVNTLPGPLDMLSVHAIVSIADVRTRWGLTNVAPAAQPTDGFWIRFDTSAGFADTNFMFCHRTASGTEACADTGVAGVTNYRRFRIWTTTANPTKWFASVNDSTPVCITSAASGCGVNSATLTTVAITPMYIEATDTTAAKSIDIDWFALKVMGLNR